MNNVSLVGRLAREPEMRPTQQGISQTMFQLCVERGVRSASGEKIVDWIPCTAFAITCEYICKYAHKGDMLSVIGKIQTRTRRDNNGASTLIVEVVVSAVNILNPKPQVQTVSEKVRQDNFSNPVYVDDEDHEGLPF